ncbi:MAG: hypothetical protein CMG71_02900 [Candidatus Marinimicrobia bacterium]|nr:hypothetical protein [Candidatus Neomarinimicrobiota bacterium]|tara:strand:- start:7072 stop:7452 length:381 start_codon:yes stop_codon:yes gene_type:complete
MTPELNLFGKSGFQDQEVVSEFNKRIDLAAQNAARLKAERRQNEEAVSPKEESAELEKVLQGVKSKKKPKKKRRKKYSGHEIFSFVLSSAIIALVLWYFVLKKSIVSTVSEYLPRSFEVHQQNSDG